MQNAAQILFSELTAINGKIGLVTLNRPESLNALSAPMVTDLESHLHRWANDPQIHAVIIQSSSDKAFCAGGDIKQLYITGQKNYEQFIPFFRCQYKLNKFIHNYPKPYIALLDGIAMGGGLGISVHGSHAIAGANLKLAMPEVAIGLYPDVGASYFLGHCKDHLGMYLGMTGNSIGVADAMYCGLIKAFVARDKFEDLIKLLCTQNLSVNTEHTISTSINSLASNPGVATLAQHINIIKTCFSKNSVKEIMDALAQHPDPWATQQLAIMHTRSPSSLKITHKSISMGATMDIQACMELDLNLIIQILQQHDIYEGIRATLVDKDHKPKWNPATLDAVSDQSIEEMFKIKCQL